jgi:predicted transcriptional regulator
MKPNKSLLRAFTIPPEISNALDQMAASDGQNKSAWITHLIKQEQDRRTEDPKDIGQYTFTLPYLAIQDLDTLVRAYKSDRSTMVQIAIMEEMNRFLLKKQGR